MDTLHVSPGNTKLGGIPSISLDPGLTCNVKWPCYDTCYARKLAAFRPNVKACWLNNTNILLKKPKEFERQAKMWLMLHHPPKFRWTVGGEWFKEAHKTMLFRLAKVVPRTKFFMYTRRDEWDWSKAPSNLFVKFSYWIEDGDRIPKQKPWAVISKEKPPFRVHNCTDGNGDCSVCNFCTTRRQTPVWFPKH